MILRIFWAIGLTIGIVASGCTPTMPSEPTSVGPTPAAGADRSAPAASNVATRTTAPSQPLAIKIGVLDTLVDAPFYVAAKRGHFAAQGLEVSFEKFKSGSEALPAIAVGQVDVAWTSYTAGMFNALARNIQLRLVANAARTTRENSALNLMVRRDLAQSIVEFADLKGRRISINAYGTGSEVYLIRALEQGQLREGDVSVIELGFADAATALSTGAIDAAMLIEPLVTITAARGIAVPWKNAAEMYGGPHDGGIVVYSETFATTYPEAAINFMVAYLQGVRDTIRAVREREEPLRTEVVEILVENLPVKERALYDRMTLGLPDPNGAIDVETLAVFYDFFMRRGQIQQPVDATRFVDRSYVQAAVARLGRVTE
jgi:NitT/TauT family transport system substrate-binding protein